MITRITHTAIYVLNQDSAYDFYVNKLGMEVRTDAPMGPGARWLTVSPKTQPDHEIILMPIMEGMFTKESAETMRKMVREGKMGTGVLECDNLYATYEELRQKGVEFTKAPTQEFYKLEAIFKDDSGNWFSLGQKDDPAMKKG